MKMLKRVLLGLVPVVFLMLFAGVAVALPPRITWTPNPLVTNSISPGESVTYTVAFKNTGYLPIPVTNQLRIVPEGDIAKYVTVVPPKFPPVVKPGQSVTFDVAVTVPGDAPVGVSDGTLVLKRVLPNGKVKEVWRAEGLHAEFTFSPIPLPPDPGEAGKITIEGIDSDGDGVRDDVQRWIVFSFSEQPAIRAGLRQFAIAQQQALLDADSEELALTHRDSKERARTCLDAMVGIDNAYDYYTRLKVQLLNTKERSFAYIKYDGHLGGHVFHDSDVSLDMCDFDPATI